MRLESGEETSYVRRVENWVLGKGANSLALPREGEMLVFSCVRGSQPAYDIEMQGEARERKQPRLDGESIYIWMRNSNGLC